MTERPWWQRGAIYQLLVPSFLDTDGDGLGDLNGVTARLDYLEWLGVNAIWLSPCYPSPLKELGYDVSDYCNIEPRFGSLHAFDRLLDEAHQRDLRVILDWVGNHTSAQHPWFRESRSSRSSPRRNWYLWRDARPDGSPPNNWVSVFGGSVWEWDAATSQYYLHTFLDSQPDLNWREPRVRAAMFDALKFWLDRGVDGFRLDAAPLFFKDPEWRDNPPNPDYRSGDLPDSTQLPIHTRNQPGLHELFAELRALTDSYPGERVLLGEFYVPYAELVTFYGERAPELHLPLNLSWTWSKWQAESIGSTIADYQALAAGRGWPTTTLDTHDQPRIAARAGLDQARVAALLLLTQRGTPTIYYGDEIGMRGVDIPAEQAADPQGRRTGRNRDPTRTPMQWSGDTRAGFSTVEPWLPVGVDRETANVATQSRDAGSLLTLTRRLLELRAREPVLHGGVHEPRDAGPGLVAYCRGQERRFLVVANLVHVATSYTLRDDGAGRIVLSTFLDREGERVADQVALRADEGLVVALEAAPASSAA
ncbi:MAG TPA: alpha-amylase family glycosyl hydrolase [Gammaproteobacteria bacterium]